MVLTYTLRDKQFTIDIRGKYNVIIGNSGTGKTFLTKFAQDLEELPGKYKGNPDIPIYGNQALVSERIMTANESIIVIDEHINGHLRHKYMHLSKRSNNYFIICARSTGAFVPYGIDTTFILEGSYPKMQMVPAYTRAGLTRHVPSNLPVIVEDSALGFDILKYIRKSTRVESAGNKDNLVAKAQEMGERCIIVFDTCGIGKCYADLLNEAKLRGHILFDSVSFEHEVLMKCFSDYLVNYRTSKMMYCLSEEDFYAFALDTCLKDKYGFGYQKDSKSVYKLLTVGYIIVNKTPMHLSKKIYEKLYEEFRSRSNRVKDIGALHLGDEMK